MIRNKETPLWLTVTLKRPLRPQEKCSTVFIMMGNIKAQSKHPNTAVYTYTLKITHLLLTELARAALVSQHQDRLSLSL